MKFFSFLLLTAVGMASAFAPSSSRTVGLSRPSTTRMFIITDPELMNHLNQNCAEAKKVTFVECDGEGCAQFTCVRDDEYGWRFESGLGDKRVATEWRQMMMEMDDTE